MKARQIEILKQKLLEAGYKIDNPLPYLEEAADMCQCVAETLQITEPYAVNSISMFKNAYSELNALASHEGG